MSRIPDCFFWNIVLDFDDSLSDSNQEAIDLINEKYGTSYTINDVTKWGKLGNLLDERLEYFNDPEFIGNVSAREGAQEFVEKLQLISNVFICTAVEPQCISARAQALQRLFPTVPPSNYIFTTRKDVIEADILLDDGGHNILNSRVKYPVLFRRPWNSHITGGLAVNNYEDFLHFVYQLSERPKPVDLSKGGCVCLIGPTCTNKSAIANELCTDERCVRPRTYTTRQARVDDTGYEYVSEKEFIELDSSGEFIEKTTYGGAMYATPISEIDNIVHSGNIAVLPIDICGAISLRNRYGIDKCLLVFCEREKEEILYDLLLEDEIDTETKVNLITSIDREMRNVSLCNILIDANEDLSTIKKDVFSVFKPVI